jgi:thiol-disulfide isomerase/thioredoxin
MRLPSIAILIALPLLAGCHDASSSTSAVPTAISGNAGNGGKNQTPDGASEAAADDAQVKLQMLDWDGFQQLLARHRGKVVVLDCWSTSCEPCIREFPNLVALNEMHSRDDLACVSLSFDYEGIGRPEEQHSRVLAFLQEKRATFDNVLSRVESDELYQKMEIPSIPAVFVYDRDGRLHRRFDNRNASRDGGPFTYEQVSKVVEELLVEPAERAE